MPYTGYAKYGSITEIASEKSQSYKYFTTSIEFAVN